MVPRRDEPVSSVSIERRTDGTVTYRVTVGWDYTSVMLVTAVREFTKLDAMVRKWQRDAGQ